MNNPFRYRGYHYDTETGLYYLQSRYYNPDLGRFISQDSPSYHQGQVGVAANLYAYVNNNPINEIDLNGEYTTFNFWSDLAHCTGFDYSNGIYYSYPNCWQKNFGYSNLYDDASLALSFISIDWLNQEFSTDGLNWRIELWKGRYYQYNDEDDQNTGAEIGVYYNKPGTWQTKIGLYNDVETLNMSFELTGCGINISRSDYEWWLNGFIMHTRYACAELLSMTATINFPDYNSLIGFKNALTKSKSLFGYSAKNISTSILPENNIYSIKFTW